MSEHIRRKYLLVDSLNTFFRASHVSNQRNSELEERVAYCVHVTLQSINAMNRDHKADHVVFLREGRSWRKDFYKPYKANREVAKQARTELEVIEGAAFFAAYDDLSEFLTTKTNVSVLQHPKLEADDLIAGWIQCHPNDDHVIISTDTDYYQLLADNVSQYSGTSGELHTINGIYDYRGRLVVDKKTKVVKSIPHPNYILFEKCMRGDKTDNIFSAYPGVREKSTKKSIGLLEAYADKGNKGYAWNNLMLQKFMHHDGTEHRVLDDYQRNVILVDLSAQPDDIREHIVSTVTNVTTKNVLMIGAHFLKFCGKYDLTKLSEQATTYAAILGAQYPGKE